MASVNRVDHTVADLFDPFLIAVWKPTTGALSRPKGRQAAAWARVMKACRIAEDDDAEAMRVLPIVIRGLEMHLPV